MKPKNVIVWILLLGIVVLLMSTSVQAKKEDYANDILKQIENGEDIYLENVRIKGELNLSKIKLETVPNVRSDIDILAFGLEKELKIVESNISILDSVFEEDVDFSNTQFRKNIKFIGTSFPSKNDFSGANFARDANFRAANFTGGAYFRAANFTGDANFWDANFTGGADFWDANFTGGAYFWDANFTGGAYFMDANFARNAYFRAANFAGGADFGAANFARGVDFGAANFARDVRFKHANFARNAYFRDANFTGGADFEHAIFAGGADFEHAIFTGYATFFSTKFDEVSFIGTTFTNVSLKETDFNQMNVEWSTLKDALVFDGRTYIKLIKNFREMEQFEDADDAYYQYRRLSQANKKWSSKLINVVAGASCGYGVKPERPLIWAFVLIMVFTLVYWRGKGIKRLKENDGDKNRVSRWAAFYNAFYFSVVTFTTVGYGDWYPEDRYRIVVMIEGVLGWLLLALFIVTLANVMIRP